MWLLLSVAWGLDAEAERIAEELQVHVKNRRWAGVERNYARLMSDYPDALDNLLHHVAAQSARKQGNLLLAAQRLLRCKPNGLMMTEVQADLSALQADSGMVWWVGRELKSSSMPFDPELRNAVTTAIDALSANGQYVGLLPGGTYTLDGTELVVESGW